MKTETHVLRKAAFWAIPVMAIVVSFGAPTIALAAEADVRELRQKAEGLERKAQDLKADGQHDRAQEVMRQVEELRARANKLGQKERPPEAESPRREEIKRQLERSMAELKELRAAGKEDEARKLKQHIQELEGALARFEPPPGGRARLARERMPLGDRRDVPPGSPEMQQRLRHLEAAIENLRAAGLQEPAERLTRQAQALRTPPRARGPGPRAAGLPLEEMERLRAEVQELRQAVRELRARVEELNRERR